MERLKGKEKERVKEKERLKGQEKERLKGKGKAFSCINPLCAPVRFTKPTSIITSAGINIVTMLASEQVTLNMHHPQLARYIVQTFLLQ